MTEKHRYGRRSAQEKLEIVLAGLRRDRSVPIFIERTALQGWE